MQISITSANTFTQTRLYYFLRKLNNDVGRDRRILTTRRPMPRPHRPHRALPSLERYTQMHITQAGDGDEGRDEERLREAVGGE